MKFKNKKKIYCIKLYDFYHVFPFSVNEKHDLADKLKELERAQGELDKFTDAVKEEFVKSLIPLTKDEIKNIHLEKFFLDHAGIMEIFLEEPCTIKAEFIEKSVAEQFMAALKKVLPRYYPQSIKETFKGTNNNPDDFLKLQEIDVVENRHGKWDSVHKSVLRKTTSFVFVLTLFSLSMSFLNNVIEEIVPILFGYDSVWVTILFGMVIMFPSEFLRRRIESKLEDFDRNEEMKKNKVSIVIK